MHHNDKKIRKAAVDYFRSHRFNDPCAVTLTMKQRVDSIELDPIACSRNFSHFSNRLNKAILRNSFTRYGNRIAIIPIIERSHCQRYHYHAVIDRTAHVSRDRFKDIVSDCWDRTLRGYREIHFEFDNLDGWISYITKLSQKENYPDSIDWQNLHRDR